MFVYFGHGWGYPSRYGSFDGDRMNGMALDPASGADGRRRVYYGENKVRASIHLAPGAAVLLYRLCYASGNTEPGLAEGTTTQSKRRVDGFGAGFLDTGAGIVIADGHPSHPGNDMKQLFTDRPDDVDDVPARAELPPPREGAIQLRSHPWCTVCDGP